MGGRFVLPLRRSSAPDALVVSGLLCCADTTLTFALQSDVKNQRPHYATVKPPPAFPGLAPGFWQREGVAHPRRRPPRLRLASENEGVVYAAAGGRGRPALPLLERRQLAP